MRKYIVEFIGTFFLSLTVCMTSIGASSEVTPIAIGAILLAFTYGGGYISGAHYNPAVTLAVWLKGKIETRDALFYMLAQVLASVAAALMVKYLFLANIGGWKSVIVSSSVSALAAEIVGTFGLCWVFLNVAVSRSVEGNNYYGLAIGFTLLCLTVSLGGISGGAFNPAIALGMSVAEKFSWGHWWVYLGGGFIGGALASTLYKYVNPDE